MSKDKQFGKFRSRSTSIMSSWGPKSFRSRAQSWSLSRQRSGSFHSKLADAESERPLLLKIAPRDAADGAIRVPDALVKKKIVKLVNRHGESAPVSQAGVCTGASSSLQERAQAVTYCRVRADLLVGLVK